ncbi:MULTISPECIES: DUF6893 family small protein [Kitasatospora]|uniref:Uncharacterized protein n=2 Tax=Kitasatospora TaxID=2063 RepID=A0ABT1J3G3_9ACTN|nr:hypothetical protein [Kitasatospora paracochleata]
MLKNLVCTAVVVAVGALVWQSLPDIKRYLAIRRM